MTEAARLAGSVADPHGRSDKDWVQTFGGRQFWPLAARPEEVFLEDIAHALALQCRFTGHVRHFYSVAQHSVLVSLQAPDGFDPLWGLLHDAAEAYLVDVARPVKRSPELAGYRAAEARLMGVICDRFALPREEPAWVKEADGALLMAERRDLMAPPPRPWSPGPAPIPQRITPWSPEESERRFRQRFAELNGGAFDRIACYSCDVGVLAGRFGGLCGDTGPTGCPNTWGTELELVEVVHTRKGYAFDAPTLCGAPVEPNKPGARVVDCPACLKVLEGLKVEEL